MDFEPLKLTSMDDIQALLRDDDLQEDSDDDVFEAGDDIDEDIPDPDTEETQTHYSTDHTTKEEHQSPSLTKEQSESSHAQEIDESNSDSSFPKVLKSYDNILPLTKRGLEKHEEATISYADLKATIEGYYEENVDHRYQTDKLVKETMDNLDKTSKARVEDRAKLLKAINRVFETLETDSALKEVMKKMVESTNTTSDNLTSPTELLRNAHLPYVLTKLNAFQSTLNTLSTQCASITKSLKEEHAFNQILLRDIRERPLNESLKS
ncbi:hypothetical protein Tco_0733860 [Tanacetum coccineum]